MKAGVPEGELVAGKYELVRLIGRGGMGSVWEGRHVTLGTRVACKFIDADFASKSPEARTRFKNEARAAASLRSKHVVDVYDYGVMGDGRPYIVMEFLAGESLADRLERVGRLPLAATARVAHQVGRALQKAHAAGIVHRDLKPDNIFLMWDEEDEQDQVKVVDFGIAKFTDEREGTSHATQTGSVVGTPFFMSPEQARGIEAIDLRSDLWALGVVTFQCLTGQLPFHSEAVGDLLIKICTGEIPVPSHVAPDLPLSMDAWMARALERDRDLRFQSAREMTEALADAIGPNARSLLESQVDDERTSMRPQLHLTAGPRLDQAITLSQQPRAVRRAAAKTATTGSFRPPSWINRAAPWAAAAILVTGGTAAWIIARPGDPGAEGGRAPLPNSGSTEGRNTAPGAARDDTRTLPAQLEGTPLSELAVEQAGTAQPKSDGVRAPAGSAASEPGTKATPPRSETTTDGSRPDIGAPAAAPPSEPVPPAEPTKNLDVGLGY
jgi:serine/threonine protein kinase